MEINGPLIISVQEDVSSLRRELQIAFQPAFLRLQPLQRSQALEDTWVTNSALRELEYSEPDRMGMELIVQICDGLREHIRTDEIDLAETIVIEIQPAISITGLLAISSTN